MAALAKLVALYCGQGMAHVLEIYNGGAVTAAADGLVLIDFGGNKSAAEDAVNYVYTKLKAQTNPKIDLMVISHQDKDHLYLLGPLGDKLRDEGLTFTLGGLYAGGQNWGAESTATVKKFLKLPTGTVPTLAMEPYRSDYAGAKKRADAKSLITFSGGEIVLRVAVAQVKITSGGEDIIRNGSSAVIVIENGDKSIVLPGDATYQTLDAINDLYTEWVGGTPLIPPVAALEVPHHGALRTAVEDYDSSGTTGDFNFDIIKDFAAYLEAKEIYASAGMRNTHGHPVKEVLDVFNASLAATDTDTEYVAFVFDNKSVARRSRFDNFKEKVAKRTTILRMSDDRSQYWWTNIEVTLHKAVAMGKAVRNTRTLNEILAEQGLGPLAPLTRPPVYAPAPTPEERAAAPPTKESA